jgi:hypothetical protein
MFTRFLNKSIWNQVTQTRPIPTTPYQMGHTLGSSNQGHR